MKKPALLLALCIAGAGVAVAQNPPESVTVTGTKEREVLRGFVDSVAAPTHFIGKIARWEVPICPYTVGVKSDAAQFVTDRVKAVAAQIGAPVSADAKCTFNIEIVFTKTPQALLDDMKKNQPALLGYQSSSEDLDRLATFRRPIEARYTTATKDLRGKVEIDSPRTTGQGQGLIMQLPCSLLGRGNPDKICTQTNPYARKVDVTGARLGDGLRSNFYHIVIVVDPRLIAGQQLDAVSDYIAMLALTQLGSLDNCQTLPSIVNLLPKGCASRTGRLSETDLGYLRGLYRMRSGMELVVQKNEIASEMAKTAE
jgi:hypothetical protein